MVAQEILTQLDKKYNSSDIGKISFICHSMGGIVARAACPYLEEYHDKFYGYLSMATPHLGIMNAHTHIQVGTWLLEGASDYHCISQLRMTDSYDIKHSYLYNLSQQDFMKHFEHIYFICSPQDNFSPYYSARVQMFEENIEKTKTSKALLEMNQYLLKGVRNGVTRVDVSFNIEKNDFASWIGKTAHIMFLEYEPFLNVLVSIYRNTIFSQ
mmetsp:Transcript_5734/g.4927  ORF Transcript_5734/g.4927 Transcript_5734/m.4927 type:complete len:212 (-) Transcript_5734:30-665(-)